ncbi:MAG: hypothetical protein HDT16_03180 [Oscillibacter sp.]|nr:hypothetical protein [Oscillibacter sp.]
MKKWKKPFALLLTLAMVLGLCGTALANEVTGLKDGTISVTIDGEDVELVDVNGNPVEPILIDGTTYLPIRAIAEALGLNVDWDQSNREVQLTTGNADNTDNAAAYPWAADLTKDDVVTEVDVDAFMDAYAADMALFDEHTFKNSDTNIGDMTYFVYDPTAHGYPADQDYPVVLWLHGGGNASLGRQAIAAGGAAGMASAEYQKELGGMYIICPLANEGPDGPGSWMQDNDGKYNASLKGILDEVIASNHINDTILLAGTSAGGVGAGLFAEDYHDILSGIFWMSTTIPSVEKVKQYSDEGIKMWFEVSRHDEVGAFTNSFPEGDTTPYDGIKNFEYTAFEWIRCGDGNIASLNTGMEMGQHCSCMQVNRNLIQDDGTPDDPNHPDGVTGWFRSVIDGAAD